jgi:hypothetical protein
MTWTILPNAHRSTLVTFSSKPRTADGDGTSAAYRLRTSGSPTSCHVPVPSMTFSASVNAASAYNWFRRSRSVSKNAASTSVVCAATTSSCLANPPVLVSRPDTASNACRTRPAASFFWSTHPHRAPAAGTAPEARITPPSRRSTRSSQGRSSCPRIRNAPRKVIAGSRATAY